MTLILASSSPHRKSLLQKLGLPFICDSPDIDEAPLPDETPAALVERLAREKAQAVAKRHANGLIIGSDQVAVLNNQPLGKPGTQQKAVEQLLACSGKSITFLTGLALYESNSGRCESLVEPCQVFFRPLTSDQITCYVAKEQPLDCAGSFKSEGLGIALFEKLQGDDPNSLIGLPLIQLTRLLERFGIDVLQCPD